MERVWQENEEEVHERGNRSFLSSYFFSLSFLSFFSCFSFFSFLSFLSTLSVLLSELREEDLFRCGEEEAVEVVTADENTVDGDVEGTAAVEGEVEEETVAASGCCIALCAP